MSDIVAAFIKPSFGLLLQYALLAVLYIFIYKVIRLIYTDLLSVRQPVTAGKMLATLTVISGGSSDAPQRYRFDNFITIGRNPDNDIVLNDKYISHYHARIKRVGSEYILADLDSINSTYLNDEEITEETVLEAGDHIRLGMVVLKFER